MNKQELKCIKILKKYISILNLNHFDIKLKFHKKEHENNAAGDCKIDLKYRWAEVGIYPCAFEKENDLDHIIAHELSHIIIEPLYTFCFDLMNTRFRTGVEIEEQREIAVDAIARAIKKVKAGK